jgi:hypothetical protein
MSHVRTQIRDAVVALLPGTVLPSRVYPTDSLPCTLVYTNAESDEQGAFGAIDRRLEVVVECIAQATEDDIDTDLDAMFAAVEVALSATSLGGLIREIALAGIDVTLSAEGAAPIGRGRMTFAALYRTSYGDPTTSI